MTCAHCVLDEKNRLTQTHHLIDCSGNIFEATVQSHDAKLDVAVLRITRQLTGAPVSTFHFFALRADAAPKNTRIFCIGQPGYDDLESDNPRKTNFGPFHLSEGVVEGYLRDKIYGNEKRELGPLKHSCWTYWGHSGAPLFDEQGQLVGMHNSWDDRNAMRHGLSILTIREFLNKYGITYQ